MYERKCPCCKESINFTVGKKYEVDCGYCGHNVGQLSTDTFKFTEAAKDDLLVSLEKKKHGK
ncbi:hypothetical protein [Marinomonas atlantica]|uniref:hypothetical protein n=1 Tax=Marinomonas atlantica TaxID=1806668 RepID=UPI0008299EAA|nr:hypothetical protein [Marinomonas atlantica]